MSANAHPGSGQVPDRVSLADAEALLRREDNETLIRMILGWANEDDRLRHRLIFEAARRLGPEALLAAARQVFQAALDSQEPIGDLEEWVRTVGNAIDSLQRLLEEGEAAVVRDTCEWALNALLGALEPIYDRYMLSEQPLSRLEELYRESCKQSRPEAEELAERLLRLAVDNDRYAFHESTWKYDEILGPEGLRAYRKLARREFEKVVQRLPEDWDEFSVHDNRMRSIMERLTETSNDIDELARVISRNVCGAGSFETIGRKYLEAGEREKALQWVEEGLRSFPDPSQLSRTRSGVTGWQDHDRRILENLRQQILTEPEITSG